MGCSSFISSPKHYFFYASLKKRSVNVTSRNKRVLFRKEFPAAILLAAGIAGGSDGEATRKRLKRQCHEMVG
jgi:hypothetical protein